MELGRQRVDRTGELGVRPQLLCLGREVVVGLGALELRLAVLADHDERRQEDRLERDDQGQPRPRVGFDEQHPAREGDGMDVHERHRAGEARDRVGDAELDVGRSPSGVSTTTGWWGGERERRHLRRVALSAHCRKGHASAGCAGTTRAGAVDVWTMSAAPEPNTMCGNRSRRWLVTAMSPAGWAAR